MLKKRIKSGFDFQPKPLFCNNDSGQLIATEIPVGCCGFDCSLYVIGQVAEEVDARSPLELIYRDAVVDYCGGTGIITV